MIKYLKCMYVEKFDSKFMCITFTENYDQVHLRHIAFCIHSVRCVLIEKKIICKMM